MVHFVASGGNAGLILATIVLPPVGVANQLRNTGALIMIVVFANSRSIENENVSLPSCFSAGRASFGGR